MSVSKEERERLRTAYFYRRGFGLYSEKILEVADALPRLLDELDSADFRIDEADSEKAELQAEVERLKIPKGMYEQKCAEFAESLNELSKQKAELQRENERLRDKVAELDDQVTDHEEELINLDRQRRGEE